MRDADRREARAEVDASGQGEGGRAIDIVERAAREPDDLAVDDLTRTRTCGELVDRAWRVASLLRDEWHLEPGQHAAMLMGNRVEFFELMLGALFAGVNLAPINWHLSPEEMRYILDDTQARAFFVDPALSAAADAIEPHCPVLTAGPELDAAAAAAGLRLRAGQPPRVGGVEEGALLRLVSRDDVAAARSAA